MWKPKEGILVCGIHVCGILTKGLKEDVGRPDSPDDGYGERLAPFQFWLLVVAFGFHSLTHRPPPCSNLACQLADRTLGSSKHEIALPLNLDLFEE